MCARGILLSDISFDFVQSEISLASEDTWPAITAIFEGLAAQARDWLASERVDPALRVCHSAIDARYEGQNFEVQVSLDDTGPGGYAQFARRFAEAHEREYGYTVDDRKVQIINCRMQAVGQVVKAPLAPRHVGGTLQDARLGERKAYFGPAHGWLETPVYDRDRVPTAAHFQGPALLEEMSSTTVVGVGHEASVDEFGNLIIRLQGGSHEQA